MERFYQVWEVEEALAYFAEHNYPVTYLLKLNELDRICVGDVLLLGRPEGRAYRVRPFETAESIAEKFGTTAERIREVNRIEEVVPFSEIFV